MLVYWDCRWRSIHFLCATQHRIIWLLVADMADCCVLLLLYMTFTFLSRNKYLTQIYNKLTQVSDFILFYNSGIRIRIHYLGLRTQHVIVDNKSHRKVTDNMSQLLNNVNHVQIFIVHPIVTFFLQLFFIIYTYQEHIVNPKLLIGLKRL